MVHNSWISRMDRAKILKAYIPPIMKVQNGFLEDDFSLQRGPLFTSIVFFWKKACLYVKIHLKLYMYICSRFRVLFPTPLPLQTIYNKLPLVFPPRGGWPWSRVPWIGRRRYPSNFGPRKNWMDQIQGWLKKHKKKGWYPPNFSAHFFHVSFFRMRLTGILKLLNFATSLIQNPTFCWVVLYTKIFGAQIWMNHPNVHIKAYRFQFHHFLSKF